MALKRTPPGRKAKRAVPADKAEILSRMPRRTSLFWDVDATKVDPKRHAKYIIERVMQYGSDVEKQWMLQAYTHRRICTVFRTCRGVMMKDTIRY